MEARKLSIISGLYANSNLDDDKGTRQKIISDMEDNFRDAIKSLYEPVDEDVLADNPFFKAMNVPGGDMEWEGEDDRTAMDLESELPDKPNYSRRNIPPPPTDDVEVDQI